MDDLMTTVIQIFMVFGFFIVVYICIMKKEIKYDIEHAERQIKYNENRIMSLEKEIIELRYRK